MQFSANDDSFGRDAATEGRSTFAVRQPDSNVIGMVERAVADGTVMLAFQPVVTAGKAARPAFYEGLVRVPDASGRIIPAKEFIEQIEPTELGRRIDCLALTMGLRTLAERPDLRLSINLSARSVVHPGWNRALEAGLEADATLGERLILEITESSAILMPDIVKAFMTRLQARGIAFALDDFGSGYTSFRYLKDLYFDILKIDGQFIRGISRSPDDQALVLALVGIGRHFDMVTVAEFVETADDAAWLAKIGVDCLQGYYFGAPTVRPVWEPCETQRAI